MEVAANLQAAGGLDQIDEEFTDSVKPRGRRVIGMTPARYQIYSTQPSLDGAYTPKMSYPALRMTTSPLRYSPSGKLIVIGWSGAPPRRSWM